MPTRTASAVWRGSLKDGKGVMRLGGGAYEGPYSFASRFEEGPGTNPEELLGAAHAGCFSMALSGAMAEKGFPPERIETTARVAFSKAAAGWTITEIELDTSVKASGLDEKTFLELAEGAKKTCPISRALAVPSIKLTAKLVP
jgi:osmotically inducible protein OsmC